jgi:hypothetical protein
MSNASEAATLPNGQSVIDTTPDDPRPPKALISNAETAVRSVLRNMDNETSNGVADPGPGQRIVWAEDLVTGVIERGHERAAARWAIHLLCSAGQLVPEIRLVAVEVGGRYVQKWPGLERWNPAMGRQMVWEHGPIELRPAHTGAGPVPYEALLFRSTPSLWHAEVVEQPANSTGVEKPKKGKDINARMLDLLSKDKSCYDWSAEAFADRLKCSAGTVKGTNAWKQVIAYRATLVAEQTHRTSATSGRRRKQAN